MWGRARRRGVSGPARLSVARRVELLDIFLRGERARTDVMIPDADDAHDALSPMALGPERPYPDEAEAKAK
jgi:hypothetical protein